MDGEHAGAGRPRSQRARTAVLQAVDDLVVEVGYADLTMTAIAERAGVSRQTVYRWWSTKAEVLLEAMEVDAARILRLEPADSFEHEVRSFLRSAVEFLRNDPAGRAYRILIGVAQQDAEVAALLSGTNILLDGAQQVLARATEHGVAIPTDDPATAAVLLGPVVTMALGIGQDVDVDRCARLIVRALTV